MPRRLALRRDQRLLSWRHFHGGNSLAWYMVSLWIRNGLDDGKIEHTSGPRTITESITIAESGPGARWLK